MEEVRIDDGVFNGNKKINAAESMFMDTNSIKHYLMSLKNKNSEGMDRIPQRILLDGADILVEPLARLFNLIYYEKKIPDQWLIAKTTPIFKNKGDINDINNYRPIANLCSVSKVFEKLILKRIHDIQESSQVDLTGENQHGFKKNKSTLTLSSEIQSRIARALDNDEYAQLTSLDLSAAFDLVNIDLLMKRLCLIGLPKDITELISVWLRNRLFYVSVDGQNSILYDLLLGTVQGSVLGPILYAIFVSPLFEICELTSFADDTYILKSNPNLKSLITDMKTTIECTTKWLRQSGLKVNDEKTEMCIFYKNDLAPISIVVNNVSVFTRSTINVLGVLFDSKLQWSPHINKSINKANKALNAIKIIRKKFTTAELIKIVTSNFFSILFYNSEIWHLPTLNNNLKHALLVASANSLKMCLHYPVEMISYHNLHKMTNRATPEMLCNYKLALQLYKTYNQQMPTDEWLHLNFNQIITSRQTLFMTSKNNNLKVGMNCLTNRFQHLNGKIPLCWLNKSYLGYKLDCKKLFLSTE